MQSYVKETGNNARILLCCKNALAKRIGLCVWWFQSGWSQTSDELHQRVGLHSYWCSKNVKNKKKNTVIKCHQKAVSIFFFYKLQLVVVFSKWERWKLEMDWKGWKWLKTGKHHIQKIWSPLQEVVVAAGLDIGW